MKLLVPVCLVLFLVPLCEAEYSNFYKGAVNRLLSVEAGDIMESLNKYCGWMPRDLSLYISLYILLVMAGVAFFICIIMEPLAYLLDLCYLK
jgi:hypothetical protein